MSVCSPYVPDGVGRITVCADSGEYPTSALERYHGKHVWDAGLSSLLYWDSVLAAWVTVTEPAQSWTPTITNLTTTSGTWAAGYHRSDGWVDFYAAFTFGASSAVAGNLSLTLPIEAASPCRVNQFRVGFYDFSVAGNYVGMSAAGSTTSCGILAVNNGTYVFGANVSSTVPFTWATGDILSVSGRYRMTTRSS